MRASMCEMLLMMMMMMISRVTMFVLFLRPWRDENDGKENVPMKTSHAQHITMPRLLLRLIASI